MERSKVFSEQESESSNYIKALNGDGRLGRSVTPPISKEAVYLRMGMDTPDKTDTRGPTTAEI